MVLAREAAAGIDKAFGGAFGQYLLGATTPDIRVITRQARFSTHYFDLNETGHQDSVAAFFHAHEPLSDAGAVNAETRAFVAGYVSHLVMDEQYITGIYRPFFGRHEALGGAIRANVMDRLLQFDLDRAYGSDPEMKAKLAAALACTVEGIDAGFLDSETLERWRNVTIDISQRNLDWDRARGMVSNHLRGAGLEEGETLASFLDSLPELLDATIAHITSAEIDGFVQRATEAARTAVERYLGCG
jgi:hypothetical protein